MEYAASRASPIGTATQAHRQRAATSTSSTPVGTNTTAFSSRCPPGKIQNPSGAGPPMSHEQVSSRPSAGTIPGAPFAGISVSTAITASDQSSSPSSTDHGQPNHCASSTASPPTRTPATTMSRSITPTPPTGNMPRR